MSKNEKEKRGRKAQLERACTKVQEDTRQSAVTPIFYAHNRKKLQSENHGLYTQYYEEICTHIFFFVQKCGEEKRNVRPIQGRTEILRLYFYFSGKIDWKIKDIFLKKKI